MRVAASPENAVASGTLLRPNFPRPWRGSTDAVAPMEPVETRFELLAEHLGWIEALLLSADGSVLVSDVSTGSIRRVHADGRVDTALQIAGRPAGLAWRADGLLLIADMGGGAEDAENGAPPALLRADLHTGQVRILADCYRGRRLRPPVDMACDAQGGIYFSAFGESRDSLMEPGVYYCEDGEVRLAVATMAPPLGVGLSPNGRWLYWTEYATGRLFRRRILSPGQLAPPSIPYRDCLYAHPLPVAFLDSMTIDPEGQLTVAIHDGHARGRSGLLTLSPLGEPRGLLRIASPFATHVQISAGDDAFAYVSLAHAGQLVRMPWPRDPDQLSSSRFR